MTNFEEIAKELGRLQTMLGEKSMEMAELTMNIENLQPPNGKEDEAQLQLFQKQMEEMQSQKNDLQLKIKKIMLKMEEIAKS